MAGSGMIAVAERLRALRKHYGRRQEDMAAALSVPYRTYQGYEQGSQPPKVALLLRLAADGVSIDWLLTGLGPMFRADAPLTLDERLLENVIGAVDRALFDSGINLSSAKKAQIVLSLYNLAGEDGDCEWRPDPPVVDRLIRLAR